jgi:subtilisin family serine protease
MERKIPLRLTVPAVRLLLAAALALITLASVPIATAKPVGDLPSTPATADPLSGDQWALARINADEAHEITGGSPLVRVALIDSGLELTHPEFTGRVDLASSVNCSTGLPQTDPTGALLMDDVSHGTLVAGIAGASDNDQGILGVAPNVELVIVKIVHRGQPVTPAAVACAFNWVADHNIDVANASFAVDKGATGGADPLDYFCPSDPADAAAIQLVGDALRSARKSGTTVVASAGNSGIDMADPPAEGCIRMPVGLPDVIGVSGEGLEGRLTSANPPGPSNFGLGFVDFVAPGGDPAQGGIPGGLLLSTFPGGMYRRTAGTSFAAAHVTGVAALVVSRFGDLRSPKNGKLKPNWVENQLRRTVVPRPCPDDPRCEGSAVYNGFYGYGAIDAFAAISR